MEQYKAAPLGFTAADVADLPSARPLLRDFPTPLVTLSESAVAHNLATMAAWCREAGVGIAPHGKTTMSRELWNRQLDAGAWGVTVATPWQASVALGWGVPRVLLANALVQPAALRALAADADRLTVWADSTRAVEIMTESLSGAEAPVPLDVLVELGGAGGRTGARGVEAALAVASAVAASPSLRLAGVAGYEGALAHDASPESLARVGDYLAELLELHDAIEAAGLYSPDDAVILTAGGSAYFDQVADATSPTTTATTAPSRPCGAPSPVGSSGRPSTGGRPWSPTRSRGWCWSTRASATSRTTKGCPFLRRSGAWVPASPCRWRERSPRR